MNHLQKHILLLLCIFLCISGSFVSAKAEETENRLSRLTRISGKTRYETSMAIAEEMGDSFSSIVVACGTDFPDALSGNYLAVRRDAPLLTVSPKTETMVSDFIQKHLAADGTVYLLGGDAVLSESFETTLLEEDIRVLRLSGKTRYDTNLKILEEADADPSEDLLVCSGKNYPDALSAVSLERPILLVNGMKLTETQKGYLSSRTGKTILIGGTGAISEEIEEQIRTIAGDERVSRISGKDRYETSMLLLNAFPQESGSLVLVTGENFPDGLSAGPYAAKNQANIVLTKDGNSHITEIEDHILENDIRNVTVIGGEGALPGSHLEGVDLMVRALYDMDIVNDYAEKLYLENQLEDYTKGGFTWNTEQIQNGWLYYNGFMWEAFLMTDFERYQGWIKDIYLQFINDDGSIRRYGSGRLDSVMPAVAMLDLVLSGDLSQEEKDALLSGLSFIYHDLEKQTAYPEAGNLYCHSQKSDGTPTDLWKNFNICLDGIYMSQLYLIRLAESIDQGLISIEDAQGNPVTTEDIWNDIYSRFAFVMEAMRDPETGLLSHGYSIDRKETNGIPWSRGIGWFAMAFAEAAEKMPDPE